MFHDVKKQPELMKHASVAAFENFYPDVQP